MGKTSQKVTKDPKRVEATRKGRENCMNKLKESLLNDVKKGRDTSNASNETSNVTNTATTPVNSTTNTSTSETYIYSVGILPALAIGICIIFANNTSQAGN